MGEDLKSFGGIATGLARSPLGIIALFIVLVYGLAALVLMVGNGLVPGERAPLIWFLVLFPVMVLATFTYLVGWKQEKLIWPSDFKDERNYLAHTRGALEAATALAAASAKGGSGGGASPSLAPIVAAVESAAEHVQPRTGRPRRKPLRLLWVDDRPGNNVYERQAFEAVGIETATATTTEAALRSLETSTYDAIISDMGRPEGAEAGLDLLRAVRGRSLSTPFYVYCGAQADRMRPRVLELGGDGCTNDPQALFEMVTRRLRAESAAG